MVKQFLIYLSVIFFVASCSFGGPDKPKNLISKKDMVNILIDARLIGSASIANKQKMQSEGIKLDSYVFEKYGIDSLQFALSNAYYAYHLKDYEAIYNKVNDSFESLKKTLKVQKDKEERAIKKREKDSINALKVKDTLKGVIKKDSIKVEALKMKKQADDIEGVLIKPVSDKVRQSRK